MFSETQCTVLDKTPGSHTVAKLFWEIVKEPVLFRIRDGSCCHYTDYFIAQCIHEIPEVNWNLKFLLEILEISWSLNWSP